MTKYVKINENGFLDYAPKNKGAVSNWVNDVASVLADGYLPLEETTAPENSIFDKYIIEDNIVKALYKPIPEPTQEELNHQRIDELQDYLTSTDWYAVRLAETGVAIPDDVVTARSSAREEISTLRVDVEELI